MHVLLLVYAYKTLLKCILPLGSEGGEVWDVSSNLGEFVPQFQPGP